MGGGVSKQLFKTDAIGDEADEILPMWQLLRRMRSDETAAISPINFSMTGSQKAIGQKLSDIWLEALRHIETYQTDATATGLPTSASLGFSLT